MHSKIRAGPGVKDQHSYDEMLKGRNHRRLTSLLGLSSLSLLTSTACPGNISKPSTTKSPATPPSRQRCVDITSRRGRDATQISTGNNHGSWIASDVWTDDFATMEEHFTAYMEEIDRVETLQAEVAELAALDQ